jgi:hypothetical protein
MIVEAELQQNTDNIQYTIQEVKIKQKIYKEVELQQQEQLLTLDYQWQFHLSDSLVLALLKSDTFTFPMQTKEVAIYSCHNTYYYRLL